MVDIYFVAELEGNKRKAYVPKSGNSGVTVGLGLDIAAFGDLAQLELPEELLRKLQPYQGFRRDTAEIFLEDNPLELSEEEVSILNACLIKYKALRIRSMWNKDSSLDWCNDLDYKMQTVVFSVIHQYGSPKRVPQFWSYATRGMWDKVIEELRNFGDKYPTRRNKEANYLQESLNV